MLAMLAAATIVSCTVTDGDTLRCGAERVRLIGIDAPELPGHCRAGRRCAKGNPFASTRNLRWLVQGRMVRLQRKGFDHYGRTLALASVGTTDLSCAQLRAGMATYRPEWDWAGRVNSCRFR